MTVKSINFLQITLIQESEEPAMVWINKYSEKFRNLVESGFTSIEDIKAHLY